MRAPWEGDARVLDGTACAAQIKDELRARVEVLRAHGVVPGLGTDLGRRGSGVRCLCCWKASRLRGGGN